MHRVLPLFTIVTTVAVCSVASAGTVDWNFPITGTDADGDQEVPAVATNTTTGESLVVWTDHRRGNADVFGQLVSADGKRIGWNFQINEMDWRRQANPDVTYNPTANEYLVVWEDDSEPCSQYGETTQISGRRVGADGSLLGPSFCAFLSTIEGNLQPAIAFNPTANEYLVAAVDFAYVGAVWPVRYTEIWTQRLTPTGTRAVGAKHRSGRDALGWEWSPRVVANPAANEFLVVWQDSRNDVAGDTYEIWGQRVSGTGPAIGYNFRISGPLAVDATDPDVAYDPVDERYLVVWSDKRDALTTGADVWGQVLDGAASRVAWNVPICGAGAVGDDLSPALAFEAVSSTYSVAWSDGRGDTSRGSDIFAQVVDGDGGRVGWNETISGPLAIGDDTLPGVACGLTGGLCLAVWQDGRFGVGALDIFGQRWQP